VYGSLLVVGLLFIGVFYVAFITSLKTNPLEWPFRFSVAQLNPRYWVTSARLGRIGNDDAWMGGFAEGADVRFEVTYFVPAGMEVSPPQVTISRRNPGSRLVALVPSEFAADFAVSNIRETARRPGSRQQGGELLNGQLVSYELEVRYDPSLGQGRRAARLPVDLLTPRGYRLVDATLPPDRIERRGRVASWDAITPGFLGFTFKNYLRVFHESFDATSGQSLFWRWTINSFFIALVKVLTTLLFASMAGYALARLTFPGRRFLFLFLLFSMMVPAQVTFISNYLVLRDAIGLRWLFKNASLLNNPWGVIISGMVGAGAVFIMKQFFESISREVEEAARIDGANPLQTFFRVVFPMATPALGALTILTFQGAWNDFF